MENDRIEDAARYLAEHVMGYAWEGLAKSGRASDPSIFSDNGFPPWKIGGHANAKQEDYKDVVMEIWRIMTS